MGFSPSFGKDSNDEVATEWLTAVVDVTFIHATGYSGNILTVWTITRSINVIEQCIKEMVDPWLSQTLARPILSPAIKYTRKSITRTNNKDIALFSLL